MTEIPTIKLHDYLVDTTSTAKAYAGKTVWLDIGGRRVRSAGRNRTLQNVDSWRRVDNESFIPERTACRYPPQVDFRGAVWLTYRVYGLSLREEMSYTPLTWVTFRRKNVILECAVSTRSGIVRPLARHRDNRHLRDCDRYAIKVLISMLRHYATYIVSARERMSAFGAVDDLAAHLNCPQRLSAVRAS